MQATRLSDAFDPQPYYTPQYAPASVPTAPVTYVAAGSDPTDNTYVNYNSYYQTPSSPQPHPQVQQQYHQTRRASYVPAAPPTVQSRRRDRGGEYPQPQQAPPYVVTPGGFGPQYLYQYPPPPPEQQSYNNNANNNANNNSFIRIPKTLVWIIFGLAVIAIFIALVVVVSKTGSAMTSNMQLVTRTLLMNSHGGRASNTYAIM